MTLEQKHWVKQQLKAEMKEALAEVMHEVILERGVPAFEKMLELVVKKSSLPEWIKGDRNAGELVGCSRENMRRLRNDENFFKEGVDFYRKSDKIILWNRDALLAFKETKNANQSI